MSIDARRFTNKQRIALYLAQDGRCALCNAALVPGWHADHVQAWSHGGLTDVINGQALCPTCNRRKGNKIVMGKKYPLRKWQQEALEVYDQHLKKVFLLDACPAAGKTRFIAEVVYRELKQGKAEAILIVVPSAPLRIQMADDFHEATGIQLDPKWNGDGVPLIHGGFQGAVVTYQWLAKNALLVRRMTSRQPTLVCCDEVHHAQQDKAWGDALKEAFDHDKIKILLTTGTPFTTNGNPISFIRYDVITGYAIADYSINYGRAISEDDETIVRTIIFDHHLGEMTWDSEDGVRKATFEEKLNKRDASRRLNTAIHEGKEHLGSLLRRAIYKLRELREDDPDAAMLITAKNQEHAKSLAKRIREEFGINPILAISEDGDIAAGAIKAFKTSQEMIIIAVDMVSEGVNIPRIRVIVYATNVTTYLYYLQVLGRAMRVEPEHTEHTAYVFTPNDERFRAYAEKLMRECEEGLAQHDKRDKKKDSEDKEEQETIWFNPLNATFTDVVATLNGVPIDANALALAATIKSSHPELKGPSFSPQHIVLMMKALGSTFAPVEENETQDSSSDELSEKPLHERITELRQSNNKLVKRLYYANKGAIEWADIAKRLNAMIKVYRIEQCSDLEKLQRREALAKRWLIKGIEPEVPFDDEPPC